MAKPFYSLEEVSKLLGKSPDEVNAMVRNGALREFRDSGKVFFKADEVDKLRNAGKPAAGDSGEITLEAVDDLSGGAGDDSLPSLVDTSGGTSIIGLADIDEEAAQGKGGTKSGTKAGTGAPGLSSGDTGGGSGIRVFDDDELDVDSDPMAKTQITSGVGTAATDQVALMEGTGSGSGLLDLTREADDTSLGAELLDEIYPGEEEPAAPAAKVPASKSSKSKAAAAAKAAEEALEEAEAVAEPEPVAVRETPTRSVVVVGGDPLEGIFGALLVVSMILLVVGGAVGAAVVQNFVPDFGIYLARNFWIFLGGAAGLAGLSVLIGWLLGRAGARRA